MLNNNFIRSISYNVNNGGILELIQRGHDGTVLIKDTNRENEPDRESNYISSGDMVMLINFYRYVKDNDLQNDFINPYGKNGI